MACGGDKENPVGPVTPTGNQGNGSNPGEVANTPPMSFAVSVAGVGAGTAEISWQEALDNEGGTVTYEIFLGALHIDVGNETSYAFTGLNDGTLYSGTVVAMDDLGATTQSSFEFETLRLNVSLLNTVGGTGSDLGRRIIKTASGSYLIAAESYLTNGFFDLDYGNYDIWLIKVDSQGQVIWKKHYGGSGLDLVTSITEAKNGDLLISGSSNSNDYDFIENTDPGESAFVMRTDPNGEIIWTRILGGTYSDRLYSLWELESGELMLSGYSGSQDGDIEPRPELTQLNYLLMKLNADGDLVWTKIYGGSGTDGTSTGAKSVFTVDENLIICGHTKSNGTGDVPSHQGYPDFDNLWVIKVDQDGEEIWSRIYPYFDPWPSGDSKFLEVAGTPSGGVMIAQEIRPTSYDRDIRFIELDGSGNVVWETLYGDRFKDEPKDIIAVSDGYVVTGATETEISETTQNGIGNILVLKLDFQGTVQWEKVFGGTRVDSGYSVVEAGPNEFLVLARTESDDGVLNANYGGRDLTIFNITIE